MRMITKQPISATTRMWVDYVISMEFLGSLLILRLISVFARGCPAEREQTTHGCLFTPAINKSEAECKAYFTVVVSKDESGANKMAAEYCYCAAGKRLIIHKVCA